MQHELMQPPDASSATKAVELLRGWVIDGKPQYVLRGDLWQDKVGLWGLFLADTLNHLADALAKETGRNRDGILSEILASFSAELDVPTGVSEGAFFKHDA
jgi:hypothetical protein